MTDDFQELKIWLKFVVVMFFILCSSVTSCTLRDDQLINNLIEKGTDPAKARCAIYGPQNSEQAIICSNASTH